MARALPLVHGMLKMAAILYLATLGYGAPAEEQAAPVAPAKPIVQKGIRIHPTEGFLEVDASVCLDHGPIEVYASSPGGKVHESLLVIQPKPQLIHFGLIILGLKEGKGCDVQGDPKSIPRGEPVDLFVEWEEGGKAYRVRGEDLIYNVHTRERMEKGTWVFAGSRFVKGQDPNTGQEVDVYLANATGTVITTFRDPASILDNASTFSADDTSYVVNEALIPPRGTVVRLVVMGRDKGPKARRGVTAPTLGEDDAKRAPALMETAVGPDAAAAAGAVKALAAMGRPVLALLREREQEAAEADRKPWQALFTQVRQALFAPGAPPMAPQPEIQPAPPPAKGGTP